MIYKKKAIIALAALTLSSTAFAGMWWFYFTTNAAYNERGFITFHSPVKKQTLNCNEYDVKGKSNKISYDFDWTIQNYPVQYYTLQLPEKCVRSNKDHKLIYLPGGNHYTPKINSGSDLNFSGCTLMPRKSAGDKTNANCEKTSQQVWNDYLRQMCYKQFATYSWDDYRNEYSAKCTSHPVYLARVAKVEQDGKLSDFKEDCDKDNKCFEMYESINKLVAAAPFEQFKQEVTKLDKERKLALGTGSSHLVDENYNTKNMRTWIEKAVAGKSSMTQVATDNGLQFHVALKHVSPSSGALPTSFFGVLGEYKELVVILEDIYKRDFKKLQGSIELQGRFREFDDPELQAASIDWQEDLQKVGSTLKKPYNRSEGAVSVAIEKPDSGPRFNHKINLKESTSEQPAKRAEYQAISSCQELNKRLPKDIPALDCEDVL